jgi:hypothetical protein
MSSDFTEVNKPAVPGDKIDEEKVTVNGHDVKRQCVILRPGSEPLGCLVYHIVAASGTNEANIKPEPGQVYGYRAYNAAGYQLFVKLHNVDVTPTPGEAVKETIGLQAGLPDKDFNPIGSAFDTGIGITIVKGIADSDVTGVAANDCVVDLFYK